VVAARAKAECSLPLLCQDTQNAVHRKNSEIAAGEMNQALQDGLGEEFDCMPSSKKRANLPHFIPPFDANAVCSRGGAA